MTGAAEPAAGETTRGVTGWDVGGANTKVARVAPAGVWPRMAQDTPMRAAVRAYEIQRDPRALPECASRTRGAGGYQSR